MNTSSPQGVSVVIPVHNNAATLPELVDRLRKAFTDSPLQIVLVDDASRDNSVEVIAQLGLEAVALSQQRGQNIAILAGLAVASAPLTCVLDADLQDPPEALPAMVSELKQNERLVVFSSRDAPWRVSSRLFRWTMRTLFPSLPKAAGLCFALGPTARQQLLDTAREGDYLIAIIGALELPTLSVFVQRGIRPAGRSAYAGNKRLAYALRMLASAIPIRFRNIK